MEQIKNREFTALITKLTTVKELTAFERSELIELVDRSADWNMQEAFAIIAELAFNANLFTANYNFRAMNAKAILQQLENNKALRVVEYLDNGSIKLKNEELQKLEVYLIKNNIEYTKPERPITEQIKTENWSFIFGFGSYGYESNTVEARRLQDDPIGGLSVDDIITLLIEHGA